MSEQLPPKKVYTLYNLAFDEGITMIVIWAIIVVAFIVLAFFTPRTIGEYIPLLILISILMLFLLVIYPLGKSILFVRRQEKALHISFDDKSYDVEKCWYLISLGGSFYLVHNLYIAEIVKVSIYEDWAKGYSVKHYMIQFKDCVGKHRKIKMPYLRKELKQFQEWYGKKLKVTKN